MSTSPRPAHHRPQTPSYRYSNIAHSYTPSQQESQRGQQSLTYVVVPGCESADSDRKLLRGAGLQMKDMRHFIYRRRGRRCPDFKINCAICAISLVRNEAKSETTPAVDPKDRQSEVMKSATMSPEFDPLSSLLGLLLRLRTSVLDRSGQVCANMYDAQVVRGVELQ